MSLLLYYECRILLVVRLSLGQLFVIFCSPSSQLAVGIFYTFVGFIIISLLLEVKSLLLVKAIYSSQTVWCYISWRQSSLELIGVSLCLCSFIHGFNPQLTSQAYARDHIFNNWQAQTPKPGTKPMGMGCTFIRFENIAGWNGFMASSLSTN